MTWLWMTYNSGRIWQSGTSLWFWKTSLNCGLLVCLVWGGFWGLGFVWCLFVFFKARTAPGLCLNSKISGSNSWMNDLYSPFITLLLPVLQPSSTVADLTLEQIHRRCREGNRVPLRSWFSSYPPSRHFKDITHRSVRRIVPQGNRCHHPSRVCCSYAHSSVRSGCHWVGAFDCSETDCLREGV